MLGMVTMNLYLETYGCQMNVSDSQKIETLFGEEGYQLVSDFHQADLIIINTCSVREKPEQKVFSALGRYLPLKRRNSRLVVAVGGCVAQQWGARLQQERSGLDIVFGTHAVDVLPAMVREVRKTCLPQLDTAFRSVIPSLDIIPHYAAGTLTAFVTIMQGCNNYCSYCIVPYVRGREYSRSSTSILTEIRQLAESGIREVILLGQNVNSYGLQTAGELNFPQLLARVNEIHGIERIRFTTSHPKDLSDELIAAFVELDHLCPQFHLPLQSGSDRILERMGRGYSTAEYFDKVERLRRVCPEIAFSSDMIIGFPGESDEDFQKTVDMIRRVRYDTVYSFKYSPRPGTRAVSFPDQVEEAVKKERLRIFQTLQDEITSKNLRELEGTTQEILVNGPAKRGGDQWVGRTPTNQIVNFSSDENFTGQTMTVRITQALRHSLKGDIVQHG
jgi:tRNA-2-methylthio-N6-dimethylallyladenosine synthase